MTNQTKIRPIAAASVARRQMEGDGFEVRRAVPSASTDRIGPFIFLDHMGPVVMAAGSTQGFPEHPHAGIETLTYLFQGRMAHRDSIGSASVMQPGEAQWMRAGRGILHEETPDADFLAEGGTLEGVQFWFDLPPEHKQDAPAYRPEGRDDITSVAVEGGTLRLITGAYGGAKGPIDTYGNPILAHLTVEAGRDVRIDIPAQELAAYVVRGRVSIGDRMTGEGGLILFGEGDEVRLTATGDAPAEVMLLGGDRMTAPMVRYGPFVANSAEAMNETITAYRNGAFGQLPGRA